MPVARSAAEGGKFHCSLAEVNRIGRATVIAGALSERVVIEFGNWQSEYSEILIHRSMLKPIFLQTDVPVPRDAKAKELYLRFNGVKITAQNDSIVSNFENNALVKAGQRNSTAQNRVPNFSGFKASLGRHTEPDEYGREIEVDVYFRIIVDWNYQSRRQDKLSLHRAAIVISQAPIGVGAGPEKFYRFLLSLSPFRMLACVLADAQAI